MLFKKELEGIPMQTYPALSEKNLSTNYIAAAHITDLPRSGKILVVDIFKGDTKALVIRFFSDGERFQMYRVGERSESYWTQSKIERYVGYGQIYASKEELALIQDVLKDRLRSWRSPHQRVDALIDDFVEHINSKRYQRVCDNRETLQKAHFDMLPDFPKGLANYCERVLFGSHTYIFISKRQNARRCKNGYIGGYRDAICGCCGNKYRIEQNIRPGQHGQCEKCGAHGKYRGSWPQVSNVTEKEKICIACKVDGQLLLRWTEVLREFNGGKGKYHFSDYCYNLHLNANNRPAVYAYKYQPVMGWGYKWTRKRNGDANYEKTYLYTENLIDVFGEKYYNVNLCAGIKDGVQINFARLLDNLKNVPAAEYLFKLGLISLAEASNIDSFVSADGKGFSGVLCVSKQYLPMYQKFDVTPAEHNIIKLSDKWIREDTFAKYRALVARGSEWYITSALLKEMSFERFVNYFTKQKAMRTVSVSLDAILYDYRDYISMSKDLGVDLSRKAVRFPKDVKEAHDQILERFNEIKAEKEREKNKAEDAVFRRVVRKLYSEKGIDSYKDEAYCIVLPMSKSDFIVEGQSLKHCVGGSYYSDVHKEGMRMIFFVREVRRPTKPFFTAEIDMTSYSVRQLRGLGNCDPPPEVKTFVREFLKHIKADRRKSA